MNGQDAYARGWQMGMQMMQVGAQKQRFQQETKFRQEGIDIKKKMQKLAENLHDEKMRLAGVEAEAEKLKRQEFQQLMQGLTTGREDVGTGYRAPSPLEKVYGDPDMAKLAGSLLQATGGKTVLPLPKKEKPAKAPTTKWVPTGREDKDGTPMQQLMGWNEQTQAFDKPIGQPKPIYKPGTVNINLPKAAPSGERESIAKLMQFENQLDRITANWEKGFTGPVEGRVGWVREVTGLKIGYTDEKAFKQTVFRQIVKDISDTLLRLRSGAQINEQEYRRLTKLVPTINLPDRSFRARLASLKIAISNTIGIRRELLKESGFIAPGAKVKKWVWDANTGELK